jgi:hypothetical protein
MVRCAIRHSAVWPDRRPPSHPRSRQVFQLCWMVYGSFLVFACEDCAGGISTTNSTESDSTSKGCDGTLFQFAYVSLILCWTLVPAIVCIVCSAFLFCGPTDSESDDGDATAVVVEVPPLYCEADPLIGAEHDPDPPPPLTPPNQYSGDNNFAVTAGFRDPPTK